MGRRLHTVALRCFGVLPRVVKHAIVRLISPKFTAGVAVAMSDGRGSVFLVSHSYSKGWGLPGGLMARGESPAETATREIHEELGLVMSFHDNALVVRTPGRAHFNFIFTSLVEQSRTPSAAVESPEITDCGWFSLNELPELSEHTDLFLELLGLTLPAAAQ